LPTAIRERSVERRFDEDGERAARETAAMLADAARTALQAQGNPDGVSVVCRLLLRYEGTDTALPVLLDEADTMRAAFAQAYRQRFSFLMPERPLMIESAVAEAIAGGSGGQPERNRSQRRSGGPEVAAVVPMYIGDGWQDCPLYRSADLQPGDVIAGPASISDANSTTVIDPGWQARVTEEANILLERIAPRAARRALGTDADPVMLEIFNNLFMSIAEQMGYRLQNTAHSVNIKERLDFSCAIFDTDGGLVANAPHIPVHLGSMGASVQAVVAANGEGMRPGDAYVLNNPYAGGTHLPDVTVITPVFGHDGLVPLFYVGSRGHHADVGGISPGSMPPSSRCIADEGVLITNFQLMRQGHFRETEMRELLLGARYPVRNVEQNLADLRAQVAANEKGREELLRMVDTYGLDVVQAYMRHVQDNAEESVRRAIDRLGDGSYVLDMDNGARIAVSVKVDRADRSATIDFTGSSAQLPDNFNAPSAITTAAVLYVFRTLVADDIPLNAGCLKPLRIVVPEGSMLNPRMPAAVVAGNVETSTCITNALFGALGVLAGSQPTMNNLTFGNERYQYYETISGGAGAGAGFDGASVVQTHMTNSRMTDPEVLEQRFPVRVERYAIRDASGGSGRWHGGNGGIRTLRFLEPVTVAILSNGFRHPAFGLQGGRAGAVGQARVLRADGSVESLDHADQAQLKAGDAFEIDTPGGGGFGT
jgi:5-oxoprolinase (ATP-hydrolysing)